MRVVPFGILICGMLSAYLNQTPHKGEGEVGKGKRARGGMGKKFSEETLMNLTSIHDPSLTEG